MSTMTLNARPMTAIEVENAMKAGTLATVPVTVAKPPKPSKAKAKAEKRAKGTAPKAKAESASTDKALTAADKLEAFTAGFEFESARQKFNETIAKLAKRYGSSRELRDYCVAGHIARIRKYPMDEVGMAKAFAVTQKPGAKSQATNRRNKAEEKAFNTGNMAYSRCLQKAGVDTHSSRGKKRGTKSRNAPTPAQAAQSTPAGEQLLHCDVKNVKIDVAADDVDALPLIREDLVRHAKAMLDLVNTNGKRRGMAGVMALVTKFHNDLLKIELA